MISNELDKFQFIGQIKEAFLKPLFCLYLLVNLIVVML